MVWEIVLKIRKGGLGTWQKGAQGRHTTVVCSGTQKGSKHCKTGELGGQMERCVQYNHKQEKTREGEYKATNVGTKLVTPVARTKKTG